MLFTGILLQGFGEGRPSPLYANAAIAVGAAGMTWWTAANTIRMLGF